MINITWFITHMYIWIISLIYDVEFLWFMNGVKNLICATDFAHTLLWIKIHQRYDGLFLAINISGYGKCKAYLQVKYFWKLITISFLYDILGYLALDSTKNNNLTINLIPTF